MSNGNGNGRVRTRPTTDLIVLFLTGVVGIVLVGTMILTAVTLWRDPEADVTGQIRFMTTAVSSLMTGVIGYIGGRASRDLPPPPDDRHPH